MWYSAGSVEEPKRDALREWRMKLLEVSSRQNRNFILDNKCPLKLRNILMKRTGFDPLLHINYCSLSIGCLLCTGHHSVCFIYISTYWIIIKKECCHCSLLTDEGNETHGCSIQLQRGFGRANSSTFLTQRPVWEMSHKKQGEHKLFSLGICLHASLTWRTRYDLQDITSDLALLEMSP